MVASVKYLLQEAFCKMPVRPCYGWIGWAITYDCDGCKIICISACSFWFIHPVYRKFCLYWACVHVWGVLISIIINYCVAVTSQAIISKVAFMHIIVFVDCHNVCSFRMRTPRKSVTSCSNVTAVYRNYFALSAYLSSWNLIVIHSHDLSEIITWVE